MKHMSFKGYTDIDLTKPAPNTPKEGFTVWINPESFERTLGVKSEKDKTARSGNSSGHDAGLDAEKYSFDLYFDGTGVAGPRMSGEDLNDRFNTFLDVVYASRSSEEKKKKCNFVEMSYLGTVFVCKLESMTIRYLLFQSDGLPIRIKVSCRFTSVEKSKEDDKDAKKGSDKKKVKPVKQDTPNCECVNPAPTYEETKSTAEENGAVSLMTCSYPPAQMTPSHSSGELNYTPADGSGR